MILASSAFPKSINDNYLSIQIKCLYEGFRDSNIAPSLWVQENDGNVEAIILGYGQTVFVSYLGGDKNEIEAFLKALSFETVFTDKAFDFIKVLKKDRVFKMASDEKALPLPEIPMLSLFYETLNFGAGEDISLPNFEDFAPDTSHLLRHGFAFAILTEYGAAYVQIFGGKGILKGISVKEEYRHKGFGSRLLNSCLKYCPKGLFAATSFSENFYLKNGFEKEPYTIYCGELK